MSEIKQINILEYFDNKNIALIVIKKLRISEILDFDDCKFFPGELVNLDELFSNCILESAIPFVDKNDTLFICESSLNTEYPFATNPELEKHFINQIKMKCNSYLSIILYLSCNFESQFNLPFYPGYLDNEFDIVIYYNAKYGFPKICKTNYITNFVTRSNGLLTSLSNKAIEKYKNIFFSSDNTIAKELKHAFILYKNILYAANDTDKFIFSMQLIDFLGNPYKYEQMKEIKKNLIPFIAKSQAERDYISERFMYLTSKISDDQKQIGYRTLIIHQGYCLEDLITDDFSRIKLFRELQYYIVSVMEEYVKLYDKTWDEIQNEKTKKIDIIQKNKEPFIPYYESSKLLLIDVDFLNNVIQNIQKMYSKHTLKKLNFCKFLLSIIKQSYTGKTLNGKIWCFLVSENNSTSIINSDINNILDLENKGIENDDGIIDIHIEHSIASNSVFIHNFLYAISKSTNCILTKCYPHKDIILISDFFHLDKDLVAELVHNGVHLTLGRLCNDFSLIRNNQNLYFDIELFLLQLMGVPSYEEPDENSKFEFQV